jgi:hypothetical protein
MMPKKKQQLQRQQARAQRAQRRQLLYLGIGMALALILIGVAFYVFSPQSSVSSAASTAKCSDIQTYSTESRAHLNPGEPTPIYQSNPPTSGAHDPNPWPPGVFDNPVPAAREVHSLEHGYIIIHYNAISPDQIQSLARIAQHDPRKIIVSPFPNMPYKVSLDAWDHLQTCDGVNESAIRSFINQYRDQGPEQTPM